MLNDAPVSAILPATDLDRAKSFYKDKLGLKQADWDMKDPVVFEAGKGTRLVIYHRAEGTKAEHTVAGFIVDDVEALVKELKAKGVAFENYDQPGLKTVDHIASFGPVKSAWFKDSEGNILALNQM